MLATVRAAFVVVSGSLLTLACSSTAEPPAGGPAQTSEVTACGSFAEWGRRCGAQTSAESCSAKIVDGCNDLASALNANVVSAALGCMPNATCEDGPTKCIKEALTQAKPTAAHTALADAFCSKCASAMGDTCRDPVANEVLAKLSLPLADEIVDEVRERCTTTPGCAATFTACAQGVAAKGLAKRLSAETGKCVVEGILASAPTPGGPTGGGEPAPRCKPRTCQDLAATCGVHDDGCGGSVGCGVCAGGTTCVADGNEPNDTRAKATNLGTFTDSPLSQTTMRALTMPDGDEDWFTFKVQDKGYLGNPKITVNAMVPSLDVSAYFLCDNQTDESVCEQGTADNALGHGCRGPGSVKLQAACGWTIYDEGTVVVRIRKRASDAACTSYDLTIAVAE